MQGETEDFESILTPQKVLDRSIGNQDDNLSVDKGQRIRVYLKSRVCFLFVKPWEYHVLYMSSGMTAIMLHMCQNSF